jgi:hypothetical protein
LASVTETVGVGRLEVQGGTGGHVDQAAVQRCDSNQRFLPNLEPA